MRCEGWRRYGGAFTLGPIQWKQCENEAITILQVVQEGETEKLPACQVCWHEAIATGIEIISAEPLPVAT